MTRGRKSRIEAAKLEAFKERAEEADHPRVGWPVEPLEDGARIVIGDPHGRPLTRYDRAMVEVRHPTARWTRLLAYVPRRYWISESERLLERWPELEARMIGASDWDWFVTLTSAEDGDHDDWFQWVRVWSDRED